MMKKNGSSGQQLSKKEFHMRNATNLHLILFLYALSSTYSFKEMSNVEKCGFGRNIAMHFPCFFVLMELVLNIHGAI